MINKLKGSFYTYSLLASGICTTLIIKIFICNRSFIIDEANLARNIVEKGYSDYFQSLDYEQFAPPLYCALNNLLIQLFGVYDWVFRIPSVIAGISTLILLSLIFKRLGIHKIIQFLSILSLGISPFFLRYSTELKQYSIDALLAIMVIYLAMKSKNKWGNFKFIFWSLLGITLIWFSMPIVFILTGVGLFLLWGSKNNQRHFLKVILIIFSWLISFFIYYRAILRKDIRVEGLIDTHGSYFIDILNFNSEGIHVNIDLVAGVFRSITDPTALSITIGIIMFGIGIFSLFRKSSKVWVLLLIPTLVMFISTQFHLYSLLPRLTFFILPVILIGVVKGFDHLWMKKSHWINVLLIILMIIPIVNKKGYRYIWTDMEFENNKNVLNYLKQNKLKDQTLIINADGQAAFHYYNNLSDQSYDLSNYILAKWKEHPRETLSRFGDTTIDYWIFISHTFPKKNVDILIKQAEELGVINKKHQAQGASVYLVERRN